VNTTLTSCRNHCPRVNRVKHSNFWPKLRSEIRHSCKLVLHKIRTKMRVAIYHFLVPARSTS